MVVRVLGGGTGAKIRRVFKFQGKTVAWRSWREENGKRGKQEKLRGVGEMPSCFAARQSQSGGFLGLVLNETINCFFTLLLSRRISEAQWKV
jgi:hypothetical protein